MRKLIKIVELSKGLVLIAFIVFAILGASNLDSKEIIEPGEFSTYFFILVWMAFLLYLFDAVGKELIKSWKAGDEKRLVEERTKRMFCNIQHCRTGWKEKCRR